MVQQVFSLRYPQVLSWAITRQVRACADERDEVEMIEKAMSVLKKVARFQQEMKAIRKEKLEALEDQDRRDDEGDYN